MYVCMYTSEVPLYFFYRFKKTVYIVYEKGRAMSIERAVANL